MDKHDDDDDAEFDFAKASPATKAVYAIGMSAVARDDTIAITTGTIRSTGEKVEVIMKILGQQDGKVMAAPIAIVPKDQLLVEFVVPDDAHEIVAGPTNVNKHLH